MDFQQLRYFNSVALLGNMSKAAEVLNVSQSALSKTINKIEAEIGCELFTRNGKNISLNAAGAEFLEYSTRILSKLDEGVSEVNKAVGSNESKITIGIVGSCSEIIKCAIKFAKEHPNAVFEIDGDVNTDDVPNINLYDLLICPEGSKYERIKGTCISTDKYYVGVSKNHPLAGKLGVSTKVLDGLDMVFLKKNGTMESTLWGVQALGIKPGKTHYVSNRILHKQLIADGLGIGFISEGSLKYYEDSKNIVLIPITDSKFSIKMKIAFKRENRLSEIGKAFKKYTMEYFHITE